MTWSMKGTYVEACNCDALCPCIFLSDPTQGECTAVVGWHVEEGNADALDLSGLNVVLAVLSEGNMATTPWKAALYLDQRAEDDQAQALTEIFTGQAGGHPANLAPHIGEVLGVRQAAIEITGSNGSRTLRVDGVADFEISAIAGQGDGPATFSGHPLAIAPGVPGTVARSSHFSFRDHELSWELSEKNGIFSPFAYAG